MTAAETETRVAAPGAEPAIVLEHVSKRYVVGRRSRLARRQIDTPPVGATLEYEDVDEVDDEDEEEAAPDERVEHEVWALRDVSLEVAAGGSVGVIGRDGAGKTTLLKILAMITPPTNGRAMIRGSVAPLLRSAQGFLVGELDARGNALLLASLFGFPRALVEERVGAILSFAELDHLAKARASRYSPGLKRRLAMATILHLRPDVLLVDESLAAGDAEFRSRCLELIHDRRRDGMTLLLASKNLSLVKDLCTDAVWLEDGRIRDRGQAGEVLGRFEDEQAGGRGATVRQSRVEQDASLSPDSAEEPTWASARGAWVRAKDEADPADPATAINLVLEVRRGNVELLCHLSILDESGGNSRFHQKRPVMLAEPGTYVARATLPSAALEAGSYQGRAGAQLRAGTGRAMLEVESPFNLQISSPTGPRKPHGGRHRRPRRATWQIERLDGANRVWHV